MTRILVVAAHPDDEVLGCGGTMARHAAEGDEVHVMFMTNGVNARGQDAKAIRRRREAAERACEILGVRSVRYNDFPDNQMDTVAILSVAQAVEGVVESIEPEVVYIHHLGDLNVDHQISHRAVMTACRPQPAHPVREILAFEVLSSTEWQTPGSEAFSPNVFADISSYIDQKRRALEAYAEEMREPPHSRSIDNILRLANLRGQTVGFQASEAFECVRFLR